MMGVRVSMNDVCTEEGKAVFPFPLFTDEAKEGGPKFP